MVWVRAWRGLTGRKYKKATAEAHEAVLQTLRAQIDNSIDLGWKTEDIKVFTNFRFRHRGVERIGKFETYASCSFVNKWTCLKELWESGVHEDIWYHDLDAWQIAPIEFPKQVKEIGFYEYPFGMQGGSAFIKWTGDPKHILYDFLDLARQQKVSNDEHVWNEMQRGIYKNRITLLNSTYNVGRGRWQRRLADAEKPVKVIHFKLDEKWDRHTLPDGSQVSANSHVTPERLKVILKKYNIWHPDNDLVIPSKLKQN